MSVATVAPRQWLPLLAAQGVWWFAVLVGALGAVFALVVQLLLSWRFDRTALPKSGQFIRVVGSGLLADAVTVIAGTVRFRDAQWFGLPLWLVVLWCSFALTLPRLFRLLPNRALRALLFAVAGPLAYLAGAQLGAAELQHGTHYGLLLLTVWLILPCYWQHSLVHR